MPTYEYICKACGHRFEVVRSMHDDALTECPDCGGELRKVFTPPTITFKGSGFYATDHKKRSDAGGAKDGDKVAAKSGKSDTGGKGDKKDQGGKKDGASTGGSTSTSGSDAGSGSSKKEGGSGT
jgi:putative FmdB family regulatory protein